MVTRGTIGIALAAVLLAGTLTAPSRGAVPGQLIKAQTLEQYEMARWALGRFDAARLRLPATSIVFATPGDARCGGSPARVHLDEDPVLVTICWNSRFIILHELGHIWEATNVPTERHTLFMDLRTNVASWASLEVPWADRGREHAANIIAWGLLEDPYPIARTYPNDPTSLTAAFVFLTDREPLHDGGQDIEPPDRSRYNQRTSAARASGR
jgi:hypothetical protein